MYYFWKKQLLHPLQFGLISKKYLIVLFVKSLSITTPSFIDRGKKVIFSGQIQVNWKLRRIFKKISNNGYLKLNFLQKSHRAHVSIFYRSGARGSKSSNFPLPPNCILLQTFEALFKSTFSLEDEFTRKKSYENRNLWSPKAPFLWEVEKMCEELFHRKINYNFQSPQKYFQTLLKRLSVLIDNFFFAPHNMGIIKKKN